MCLCLFALFFLAPLADAQSAPHKKVIVISLDGFPAYALEDPRLPIPTLRKLMHEGSYGAMRPINPTVTWPNHTAMVTGVDAARHHVLFNGLLEWKTDAQTGAPVGIEPWRDKDVMVHAPTVYDLAHDAGLTTAQVDWVAIYNARTITWKFPEVPDPAGQIEGDLIAQGVATAPQLKDYDDSSAAWRDQVWTDAAVDILDKHHPDLLLLHLLCLDSLNHEYGPMSEPSTMSMAFLDGQVKRVVDAALRDGDAGSTTILIVSDHGFRTIHHAMHANVLLKEQALIGKPGEAPAAWVIPEGGSAMVYLPNSAQKAELASRLRALFANTEGVDHVFEPKDYATIGFPSRTESDQSPDLFLTARPDYAFASGEDGPFLTNTEQGGTHGYLNSDDKMRAIFVAWGAGVRSGVQLGTIPNVDVAPTIAALLGLKMTNIEGVPLTAILK
jgi:predicted AlkP superfamily pyrophosphatase or phosphodiesterase